MKPDSHTVSSRSPYRVKRQLQDINVVDKSAFTGARSIAVDTHHLASVPAAILTPYLFLSVVSQ